MNLISEYVYKQQVKHSFTANTALKVYGRFCGYVRRLILKADDPLVRMKVGHRTLIMNLSHELPLFMASHVYYDTAIVRIAVFLREMHGYLTMVDAGANIGDTVSLISDAVNGQFLCIEADEKYYQHLLINTEGIDNVHCVKALCDQVGGVAKISFDCANGSSRVSEQGISGSMVVDKFTLDSLTEKLTPFKSTNFVKIDTDGYDYKVMRGCDRLLAENRPTFFFELCPKFLRKAGEDPVSIFDYILQRGYGTALFYDNVGYPIMILRTDDKKICQLVEYANRKGTYFDVLIFHDSHIADSELFFENEMKFFEKKLD